MISVTVIRNQNEEICGFRVSGHAGFAAKGKDIVCAAVSALATNTVNSVEAFTADKFSCKCDENGLLELIITDTVSDKSKLLLDSFLLGAESISDEYGQKFVKLLK